MRKKVRSTNNWRIIFLFALTKPVLIYTFDLWCVVSTGPFHASDKVWNGIFAGLSSMSLEPTRLTFGGRRTGLLTLRTSIQSKICGQYLRRRWSRKRISLRILLKSYWKDSGETSAWRPWRTWSHRYQTE